MLNSSDLLVKENPGSMWPKCEDETPRFSRRPLFSSIATAKRLTLTLPLLVPAFGRLGSLGCLKDRQNITQAQLRQLSGICESYNSKLFGGDLVDFNATFQDNPENIIPCLLPMQVKKVHITVYECRSHERILLNEGIPLVDTTTLTTNRSTESGSGSGSSENTYKRKSNEVRQSVSIDAEEKDRVREIYEETLDVDTYFVHASKAGHKETHYREALAGSSLVIWLRNNAFASEFSKYSGQPIMWVDPIEEIRKICTEIEQALPGLYTFFDMNSLHITLRAVT